ncbi:MAG: T9SS type A sorting domain-containing protein, partial [Bacteroidia bacterium]
GSVTVTTGTPITTILTAAPSGSVCAGTNVTLNSTVSGGGSPYTYAWSGPGGFTSAIQNPFINNATTAATGTYSLTITDNCGVSKSDSVSLIVNSNPIVSVTPTNALYCNPGTAAALTASGATTYAWLPAAGLSATTGTSVNASPAVTTTYTVTGTDGNGCIGTATTAITSAPAVVGATAAATPATICSGTTTDLTSSATPYTTTLINENFNGTAPGWTNQNNSVGGVVAAPTWTLRPNGYTAWTTLNSNDNSQFYVTNSDAQGSGSTTRTILQSPAFNTTGFTSLNLSFYHFYENWNTGDTVRVQASTNGTTWTTVKTYPQGVNQGTATGFIQDNISLNAFIGSPTVYVRFNYKADWGYGWAIDNVTITGGSPNFTYAWNSTPAGYTSASQNPTGLAPMVSTAYDVTITNIFGCSATATANVTVNPSPVVALGNDTTVCGGITLDAANAGNTYLWSDASTSQTLTATSSGTYYVDVTTPQNCTTRDSIVLTVNVNPTVNLGSDITQCGGTDTLDAQNAGNTYLWSDASTSQTLIVTNSGTYFVDVTSPMGCTKRDSIDVVINPVPVVNLGSDINQCGGTVNLDAQNPGAAYLWSDASTGQMLSVSDSGLYFVDVTNGFGCTTRDSITIAIRPVPVVNLGSDTAMCGGNIILDAQNVGSTFLWSDASTSSFLFVFTTGTYYVDVTNPEGCTASDTINVTIAMPPIVNLGSDIVQCGGTATLDAQNAGSSFTWSDASTSQTLVVSSSGTYYVDVASAPGCSSSDTINVTINAIPTVTFALPSDTVCLGTSPVTLSGGAPAGGTYSGTSVSGGNFDPAVGVGSYVITYTYTDVNSCSSSDVQTMYVDACTGIAETKELSGIALYPNPTYGNLFLEFKGMEGKVMTQIYTPEGKLMFAEQLNAATTRHSLSVAHLPNGVYYVRLTSGSAVKTIKLVKQE